MSAARATRAAMMGMLSELEEDFEGSEVLLAFAKATEPAPKPVLAGGMDETVRWRVSICWAGRRWAKFEGRTFGSS
jgi:hypothetical protein